ncbi:hypothetical protein LUZ60_012872 [Juncus effusus]|nr:hypothetical protein LUZ60_012872 [Juncus effusus]
MNLNWTIHLSWCSGHHNLSPILITTMLVFQIMCLKSMAGNIFVPVTTCRSYCGNLTVDYPFALRPGCGHAAFRNLLFCVNGILMLHIPSGSYRVLNIDYAYHGMAVHDPSMSDCYTLNRSPDSRGNGFVVESWRAPYLQPDRDNVFLLLGCRSDSPIFQGFPAMHLACRSNVLGISCEDYYRCPAWEESGIRSSAYGRSNPPECCALEFSAIGVVNMSHLQCEGYSSAYSVAPLRAPGPGAWAYGIRLTYTLPDDNQGFCGSCRATGGVCGHDEATNDDLCICGDSNSTSNCDSLDVRSAAIVTKPLALLDNLCIYACVNLFAWWIYHQL